MKESVTVDMAGNVVVGPIKVGDHVHDPMTLEHGEVYSLIEVPTGNWLGIRWDATGKEQILHESVVEKGG